MTLPVRIRLFWGSKWALRGISFSRHTFTRNVHYKSLIFLYGFTWKIRILNARRAWKSLLTLGAR